MFSNPTEYMPLNETFSPVLHRIDQAVRWRAVHPDQPIPPPYEILTRYSRPPETLVAGAKSPLERTIAAADIKKGRHSRKNISQTPFQPPLLFFSFLFFTNILHISNLSKKIETKKKSPQKYKAANAIATTSNPSAA